MAIKFEKIQPGMELWDYRRVKGRWAKYLVRVVQVEPANRMAYASWNSNPPKWYREKDACKWYASEPKGYREQQERDLERNEAIENASKGERER